MVGVRVRVGVAVRVRVAVIVGVAVRVMVAVQVGVKVAVGGGVGVGEGSAWQAARRKRAVTISKRTFMSRLYHGGEKENGERRKD